MRNRKNIYKTLFGFLLIPTVLLLGIVITVIIPDYINGVRGVPETGLAAGIGFFFILPTVTVLVGLEILLYLKIKNGN